MAHVGEEALLERLASSADSLVRRSSSSNRFRSVTSVWTPTKWVTRPYASCTGAIARAFQKGVPSLR